MLSEINYLLFNSVVVVSFVASAVYLVFFFSQREDLRTIARTIFIGSGVLQSFYILSRYIIAGHTPITSQHEAVVFFAWSVTWAYLSFHWRYSVRNFGTFVSILVFIMLLIAAMVSREFHPLAPALQSLWLPVHAGVAVMAYGFLALAFCGAIMYLLQERELKSKKFGFFFSRLPSLDSLDQLNNHCLTAGFGLLTLGIITGSIWARQAWGTYWHWDPKETWSLITWFLYAAQIHQRFTLGWRGKRAAVMSIVGFIAVIFTLWGVNYLLGGVHSYAQ
ncbi:cytochrome c-type biogenesis protein CcsB [Desulfocapsa sulfexigens DSM 10523]|uniref:Cytochrome c-type biogenesis protein CcsB n=1 Tax=Desulfocapsa sulfexigens (strain DSM 10523 / SB164P1) TaxID=1167006 RepID=M1P5R9_DESSD|nr:c-type cytochrome biogenesis protein CcsB [Desulfocapsa sulfexigens]AGF77012.1 cytochrome c-type biogenesis protein CcsB [Desulfocapsa sulfexigens DSM 10523]